ncbi:hypothetical protein FSP39_024490 [Pinctada imbricata]|uniref:Testicular haploid expressed protein n=1 Tax=Pinctada imbricata TaxID=66713 RepID=A0AA88Y2A6_PINIB|nr:hypothetical protein FSP39_024490 [Pinctada imbricata]
MRSISADTRFTVTSRDCEAESKVVAIRALSMAESCTFSLGEAEYERIRQTGSPNVMWGTQEMLWPIPQNIKEANERVRFLAEAKKNFQPKKDRARSLFLYSCGRASAIWTVRPGIPEASVRVSDLARHKEFHEDYKEDKRQYLYSCGRDTPIWKVTDGAKSASERPRTKQLAEHRPPHPEFQPAKPIETIIPTNALSASASERLQALASPKRRSEGPFRPPQWPVSPAAKSVSAKPRSMELARPKGTADGYQLPRDEIWVVTRAAKKASASGRIDELSKPLVRASMDHVQFNPDAFLVRETALKGVIPRRVHDLANPIQR